MKQRRLIPIVVVLGSFVLLGISQTASASIGFVQRAGTHFALNGVPFYVGGVNNHYIAWASQQEVDNVLNDAAAMHFNVVRTFISVVRGSLDGANPTIWNWNTFGDPSNMGMEGTYHAYWDATQAKLAFNDSASGLQKIDYLLKKANSLNVKVLISLNDFWAYTGGIQQMRAWYGSTDKYTFFYSDPRTKQDYKNWVSHVLNHVNTLTGVAYKNDPAIFAWDLMNEPEVSSIQLAQSWIGEMSTYVKSIDPNHMVASGSEGFYGGQGGSDFPTELTLPNIDFGTWHSYPIYNNITPAQVIDRINQHCATASAVQKPVLLEEFGYSAANSNQAQVYQSWTDAVRNNPNCAGWIVWRLTSLEANNAYPRDNGEGFDFHKDSSQTSTILSNEALMMQQHVQNSATMTFTPTHVSASPTATTMASRNSGHAAAS